MLHYEEIIKYKEKARERKRDRDRDGEKGRIHIKYIPPFPLFLPFSLPLSHFFLGKYRK
jgi:hypothetical protein